jgi:membrane protease subunit HflK
MVRRIAVSSLLVFLAVYLLSGIYVVKPEQQALIVRFGKLRPMVAMPGTHYRIPYPVDKVMYFKPSEVKSVVVGKPFYAEEAQPEPYEDAGYYGYYGEDLHREFLTGDENIIHITLNVQYRISDPAKYLFAASSPERLVTYASEAALAHAVARTGVDTLLTSGKQLVLAEVKRQAQALLDKLDGGVAITLANFADVSPPAGVVDAFKDVASALEDRDRAINEAMGDHYEAIALARGEAEKTLAEAMGQKTGTINRARGATDRLLATLVEYRLAENPEISLLRLYVEAMENILPAMKKYVIDAPVAE